MLSAVGPGTTAQSAQMLVSQLKVAASQSTDAALAAAASGAADLFQRRLDGDATPPDTQQVESLVTTLLAKCRQVGVSLDPNSAP
jgi:hypothetical protein